MKKRKFGPKKQTTEEEKEILVGQGALTWFPSDEKMQQLTVQLGWDLRRVKVGIVSTLLYHDES